MQTDYTEYLLIIGCNSKYLAIHYKSIQEQYPGYLYRTSRKVKGNVLTSCVCYPGVHAWLRNEGTNKETPGQSTGLQNTTG